MLAEVGGKDRLTAARSQTAPAKGWSRKRSSTHLNHSMHVFEFLILLLMQSPSQEVAAKGFGNEIEVSPQVRVSQYG